jgi:hypothetical protein
VCSTGIYRTEEREQIKAKQEGWSVVKDIVLGVCCGELSVESGARQSRPLSGLLRHLLI